MRESGWNAEAAKTIAATWMTAIDDWHIVLLCHSIDSIEETEKVLFCVDIFLSVGRKKNVFSFSKPRRW